ncbi:unnamed protein product [Adineta ricciae]|uniref:ADP-ribosyl cyclase/cyclic ADP-ribose hydrolase n=1 Tax=Adineta ricciae TaxID=249248 RepID=A0A815AYE4_ADIRI|nr:unnamed protein product [Adineta ricciae]
MIYNQVSIFSFVLLLVTDITSLTYAADQKSSDIHLEAPVLADRAHSNRPPIRTSISYARKKPKPKFSQKMHLISSCNGSYTKTNGTTCGLKEIMIGRCYEYQYLKYQLFLTNQSNVKNCTQLYQAFESAVRYKPYCNMNMSTYEKYFQLALSDVHVINRAMFWSGTYGVTHAYSADGANYITLEDTLAAAMVNGLVWCGNENHTDGFDFFSCPNNCKDNRWADLAFWGLASKTFAQLAAGEIYVVLNGSHANDRPAFRNNSYFSDFELPNFRRTGEYRVTKINILLLHSPDKQVTEKCGEKSLVELENLILAQGFQYACKDDPEELILIMCGNQWEARECQIARHVLRQAWDMKLYGTSLSKRNSHSFLLVFLTALAEIFFLVKF